MKKILLTALIASCFGANAAVTNSSSPGTAALNGFTCLNGGGNADGGTTDTLAFTEVGTITDANIDVAITHEWRGDLQLDVTYDSTTVVLYNTGGGNQDDLVVNFDSDASSDCATDCAAGGVCETGTSTTCSPSESLTAFNAKASNLGNWTLRVCDNDLAYSDGTFDTWAVTLQGQPGDGLPVELMSLEIE
ncbi:MAG: hypothetical protein AB8B80_02790 [Marinicellaceae bacterium]